MLRDNEKMYDYYINIAERSCGFKPEKVQFDIGSSNKNGVVICIKTNTEVVLVL